MLIFAHMMQLGGVGAGWDPIEIFYGLTARK